MDQVGGSSLAAVTSRCCTTVSQLTSPRQLTRADDDDGLVVRSQPGPRCERFTVSLLVLECLNTEITGADKWPRRSD